MKLITTALIALLLLGCSSGEGFFRLEEYGEGWDLKIEEEEESFKARWIEGDHRSVKLVNYYDDDGSEYYILNTLYLELEEDGTVAEGRLKRVVLPEFEQRSYYEQKAQWFRVLQGSCTLNDRMEGRVNVRCEGGYEFDGEVMPMDEIKIIKPE